MRRKTISRAVTWLSDKLYNEQNISTNFNYYEKFQFGKLTAGVGDFVLISNADSAEPDTEEGCDAARIITLYEDISNNTDPFRAKVQWYSRPSDIPSSCLSNTEHINFIDKEVLEDHRPFSTDVSIETFFAKCQISFAHTKDMQEIHTSSKYHYACRYRIIAVTKRKVQIEPVLEEERMAMQYLQTPSKNTTATKGKTPKTPTSLVKRMSRVSISEPKNWSVSKNDGTKLLLKRAILADKTEKDSPKKSTPKSRNITPAETPKSTKKLSNNNIEELLTMELKENADGGLPTLIIRQHVLGTPKRKVSVSKAKEGTPKKVLTFDDDDDDDYDDNEKAIGRSRRKKSPVCYDEDMSPVKPTPTKVTRSGRVTKNTINYAEPDSSPVKRTPRKSRRADESDDEFKPTPVTPKTPRTPRAKATPAKTPKSVTRKILISQLTPTLHSRAHSVDNIDEILKENNSLPGREGQMEEILSFVRSKLLSGTSGCMYISGVPGTGKTATVCSSLKLLKDEPDLPEFQLVEINGMRIAEPRQAYVQIYKQLTGKTVVWEQACTLLEKRFNNPGPRRTPTVLLVDELDALCTRRQDVLYSIAEWAARDAARLSVLCVANTMDLPERALAARVASRLGLTRLTFPPYTHAQLQRIVAARLASASLSADAIQLIARKVAAVSGDARRAIALCSRALELAAGRGAGLGEVQRALEEAASGAAVRAVRACSPAERLMLRAVAAEVERTGSDETTLSRALATAAALVSVEGRPYRAAPGLRPPSPAQARAACARLAALRLLLLEPKAEPRLLLNVSADDVHYATRQMTV